MKASPVVQRTVSPGLCDEQQARDRAQQVGLADTGRSADEQRVVGLRRHLGDGQRGGVREAVAVADHELVEGELGIAERAAWRVRCGPWRRARVLRGASLAARVHARRAWPRCVRPAVGRSRRARRRASGPSTSSTLAWSTLPKRSRIQPQACGGRFDEQALAGELDGAQRLEPDAVGGLVDGERKLGLHA